VPLGGDLYLGLTPKYQWLDGPDGDSMRAFNADVSLFARLSRMVGFGAAGYNLLSSGHHYVQPRAVGVGLSAGDEGGLWRVAFDWRGDFDRQNKLTSLLAAGAEVTLADLVPVRAGFQKDDTRNASFWSAGVGIATSNGFGIDVSYRQRLEDPNEFTLAAGLKLLVPGV
jgi:opacity protein-like surface antigen